MLQFRNDILVATGLEFLFLENVGVAVKQEVSYCLYLLQQ